MRNFFAFAAATFFVFFSTAQDSTYLWTCGNSLSSLYNSDNHYNQFGNPWPYSYQNPPVPILLPKKQWISVASVGAYFSAVAEDGSLWQWSTNLNSMRSPVPGQVTNQSNCRQVVYGSGSTRVFLLKNDGSIWRSTDTSALLGNDVWTKIGSTSTAFYALKSDSSVWQWSMNASGVLSGMAQIGAGSKWIDFAITSSSVYGVKDDGTLWRLSTNMQPFLQEGTDSDWKKVFGKQGLFAIKQNGTLWVLGNTNTYGQLGIGSTNTATTLTQVGTDTNWDKVFPGIQHSLGLKTDGSLFAWGRNHYYQLGVGGSTGNQTSPVQVGATGEWRLAEAGDGISVMFRTWGYSGNTTTPTAPAAPSNLTATPTNSIQLNWQDNSTNEDGFHIESANSALGPWTIIHTTAPNVTGYLHTGLTSGLEYFYRVKAFNASGESGFSNVASAVEGAVGIEDAILSVINFYPNPANNVLNISSMNNGMLVEIYETGGRLVARHAAENANDTAIDISGLQSGVYFLRITHNQTSLTHKLLIGK